MERDEEQSHILESRPVSAASKLPGGSCPQRAWEVGEAEDLSWVLRTKKVEGKN